jgi:hypothetical protein
VREDRAPLSRGRTTVLREAQGWLRVVDVELHSRALLLRPLDLGGVHVSADDA